MRITFSASTSGRTWSEMCQTCFSVFTTNKSFESVLFERNCKYFKMFLFCCWYSVWMGCGSIRGGGGCRVLSSAVLILCSCAASSCSSHSHPSTISSLPWDGKCYNRTPQSSILTMFYFTSNFLVRRKIGNWNWQGRQDSSKKDGRCKIGNTNDEKYENLKLIILFDDDSHVSWFPSYFCYQKLGC